MSSRLEWALAALMLCASVIAETARAGEAARVHGIAMHGDLAYPADFTHFRYANPNAPKGGVLRQYALGTFDSFNPFIVKGNPASGVGSIYDTLLVQSHDEPFSMYGLLAESIELPSDRSWVAFTLREGARWHDGRPVSVEDVIWSFHTLVEKGAPLFRFYYAGVDKVEKTGARSVAFRFKPGENRELPLIVGQIPIFPKHFWEERSFDETSLEPPLGSGPYEVAEFEPGRFVSYRRRADYWGAELPVNRGHQNFDVMRFEYYRDMDVAVEALKADAYDVRNEMSATKWATAYDTPDVREGRLRKELVPHSRNQGIQGFVFNLRREKFADRRVREAIGYAFDFEWMNRNLFYGQYQRARSYFENSELAARGAPSPLELKILEPLRGRIPDEVFERAYEPPATDGSGRIRDNLRRATELLAQAGWAIRDGALANAASGERMQFEILLVEPSMERVALPFKKNLERLGIGVEVRTVDVAQYRRRLDTYDFDMTTLRLGQSSSPGNEQRDFWSSASAQHEGGRNLAGIASPAIDELIELVIAATSREELVARVHALDRVLQWGFYLVPHFYIAADRLLYWDRFGMPEIVPSDGPVLETWWYDAQKAARLERARGGGD